MTALTHDDRGDQLVAREGQLLDLVLQLVAQHLGHGGRELGVELEAVQVLLQGVLWG